MQFHVSRSDQYPTLLLCTCRPGHLPVLREATVAIPSRACILTVRPYPHMSSR